MDISTRFWMKVSVGKPDECWEWQARVRPDGYGVFSVFGKTVYAHRVSYELAVGQIPEKFTIDHLCRNRACVNPKHLEAVTFQENVRRGNQGMFQLSKTHCPQGHPYDAPNTYIYPDGRRECRTCGRGKARARIAAKRKENK